MYGMKDKDRQIDTRTFELESESEDLAKLEKVSNRIKLSQQKKEQSYSNAAATEVEFKYFRPDFFELLGNKIPHTPGVVRRIDNLPPGYLPIEFRFIVGSEDLYTYEQLTNPGSGVVQDRPLFTTVENGVGLFTSRLIHSEFRNLSVNTISALDTSEFTRDLNFQ